ncbi:MAG: hypothetical protein Kow0079_03220 [Vicingaceae bacterium]
MLGFSSPLVAQFYNGTHTEFGQNRVQYDEFEWQYFRFERYETYFYKGGKEIAEFTAKKAKIHMDKLEKSFDFYLKDNIQFIIYNKQSHFKQSNLGVPSSEEYNLGGSTTIIGSKIFLYFDGNHQHLENQIRAGIAQIMIHQQVYGSSWRQALTNSALLTLPDWYLKGLTSYYSSAWNPEIENQVRDGINTGRYKRFNRLEGKEAIIAGHSMWNYITETYGESVIPNILYMTRVTQSIERGFLYVLGVSMKSLRKDWLAFYENKFSHSEQKLTTPPESKEKIKIRRRRVYTEFKLSPNGKHAAYVTNKLGQIKLYVHNFNTKKSIKILRKEHKLDRIIDYSYPKLAWHPSGEILAFTYEEKGILKIYFYELKTGLITSKAIFNMEKILDFDYHPNGKQIVFSGVYKGQSDIYLYTIASNAQNKLTNDIYDDDAPKFIENGNKIVFCSNRTTDTLILKNRKPKSMPKMAKNYDVFILDYTNENNVLTRVTQTPSINERNPDEYKGNIIYLSPKNGIENLFLAKRDSFITHIDTSIHYKKFYSSEPLTNYKRSILSFDYEPLNNRYGEIFFNNKKYRLIVGDADFNPLIQNNPNQYDTASSNYNTNLIEAKEVKILKPVKSTPLYNYINIHNYTLYDEKSEQNHLIEIVSFNEVETDTTEGEFVLPQQRNYNLSFFNENSTVQLNNSFINGQYQIFTGGPFITPGMGGIIKFGIADLFEDYKIYGGIRLAGGTNEYFFSVQNLVHRMDKEYTLTRTEYKNLNTTFVVNQNNQQFTVSGVADIISHGAHYSLSWPFSEVTSLRSTISLRQDQVIAKATDFFTLQIPNQKEYRSIIKLAYVFDNTRKKATNIYYGTRFKLFSEYYQKYFSIDGINGNMHTVGMDFRRYQEINRELIWVGRLAGGTSFGKERLVYYLGSVDNWLILGKQNRFDSKTDIDYTQNYMYQALAANLRGFPQNIRNGTSFAVINSELRWPIFKYFIRRPIRSNFIRNFQIVGFGDLGTAWNGLHPYQEGNTLEEEVIISPPVVVTLKDFNNPLVAGYGFGLRSTVLGYFVRTDWAWGVENGVIKKPIFYLSLSLDI